MTPLEQLLKRILLGMDYVNVRTRESLDATGMPNFKPFITIDSTHELTDDEAEQIHEWLYGDATWQND